MVAPSHPHPKLGFAMPVNLARNYLHRANDQFQAGHGTAAGVFCREALRRILECLCIYHECRPKAKHATPSEMVDALFKIKVLDTYHRTMIRDLLATCNRAAHAHRVRRGEMDCTLCLTYRVIDMFKYLWAYERACSCGCKDKPEAGYDDGYDDGFDDRDGADWWKGGGSDG